MAKHSQSDEREKTYKPDYYTQQGYHSNMKEKSKALQTRNSSEYSAPPNQLLNECKAPQYIRQMLTSMKGEINSNPVRVAGDGNGNPLQYSCLENPMDGGAW